MICDPLFFPSPPTPSLNLNTTHITLGLPAACPQWTLLSIGNDSITINFNSPNACSPPCAYFIGVYGFGSRSSYSLLASLASSVVVLFDGQPQYGYVSPHTLTLYQFDTTDSQWPPVDVEISLEPFSGSLELYAIQAQGPNGQSIVPTINCTTTAASGGRLENWGVGWENTWIRICCCG